MNKRTLLILAGLLIIIGAVMAIAAAKSSLEKNLEQLVTLPLTSIDLSGIEDGTYTGRYKVFPITAEVRVTVSSHRIDGIELVRHEHGQGASAEVLPDRVVEGQTLHVDIVSGATYSSKVILKAIEDALLNAVK